ncbi:MAG TPA: hypothetical protein VF731_12035 [Solirubrobacterales bacterium]
MIGTYAAVLAVGLSSLAVGQAAIGLCGARRWSWLSPAVGLALLCAVCWGTVRLPGHGVVSAVAVLVLTLGAVAYLWRRLEGGAEALRVGGPVALIALLAASLPFAVEGHFGILGTSFNPDMSQHLLAADRLAHGASSDLLRQGYPLGPHSVVVALNKGLGVGLVQGFSGLTVAVAVLAPLTALAALRELPAVPRTAAALVVGLAYVVASYFAQGAFKETMQALFLLGFALALRESGRSWAERPLRFVPAALIAVGSIYTYSFPGLLWLGGAFVIWAVAELARGRLSRAALRPLGLALLAFVVPVVPEVGRMLDFRHFETFNPNGPGLGNLFGQISPFEALGIWPSGDFRLAPGDGAVPAPAYYLGIAFGLVLLGYGLFRLWQRRETAILSGLAAAALAYLAARLGGTPYTAAKAIEIAAPLVALAILLPLLDRRRICSDMPNKVATAAAALFLLAAGICSLLALANAPVGPTSFSPALSEFRGEVGEGSTLVIASRQLLEEEHGEPYLAWEMRGGRVCVAAEGEMSKAPPGVRFVITPAFEMRASGGAIMGAQVPFSGFEVRRARPPYVLWEATGHVAPHSPCPLIAVRQARQGPAR